MERTRRLARPDLRHRRGRCRQQVSQGACEREIRPPDDAGSVNHCVLRGFGRRFVRRANQQDGPGFVGWVYPPTILLLFSETGRWANTPTLQFTERVQMTDQANPPFQPPENPANGPAWAALLSSGIGGVAFGILTILSESFPKSASRTLQ